MHVTHTARLLSMQTQLQQMVADQQRLLKQAWQFMTPLQVDKLLSKGGHFFTVTVPENKPAGELHMIAVASVSCCPPRSCTGN